MLDRLFNIFIPNEIQNDITQFAYAKNLVGAALLALITAPAFAVIYYTLNFHLAGIVLLIATVPMFGTALVLKYGKSLVIARAIHIVLVYSVLTWLSYHLGGLHSATAFWLILPPLLSILFGALRTSLYWTLTVISTIATLYVLQISQFNLPLNPISNPLLLQVLSLCGLTLVVLFLSYFFERSKTEAEKQIYESNRQKLAKQRIEDTTTKAVDANKAKSTFLAEMSHEIRTPLNGVLGMTNLLIETPLSAEQREYTEVIRVSSEALLSIINNILDFSKIEAGYIELESTPFDLTDLVDDAVEIVSAQCRNKENVLTVYVAPDVPSYYVGDPGKVRQIFINLLNNAIKFTEKGKVNVEVKLQTTKDDNINIVCEVSDTGIGMSKEAVEKLFQPFVQADTSISRKYGGTGLGLTIAKRLIEMMGGTISVESILGYGSKFKFNLRLKEFKVTEKETDNLNELANMRVLYVDDDVVNQEIIKHQLEYWRMRCDVANEAGEALAMLKKAVAEGAPYSLALIDFVMPGMSGFELIQIIRQLSDIANTPIIIISSYQKLLKHSDLEKYGISVALNKPVRRARLLESISSLLKKKYAPNQYQTISNRTNKILLAEDNIVNQKVLLTILAKLGYQADVVDDGEQVLKALEQAHYDLILMDCQMPKLDGMAATRQIRSGEKQKTIPIIAMTASDLAKDRDACIKCGMDDYLTKPIDIKQLTKVLDRWLACEHK